MALTVNTNTAADRAITQLNKSSRALTRSFARISSGLRISKAADDAAGLGVAENLKVAASSAKVALRNVGDGISMIAVAEGATAEVAALLGRMRDLAVQGASDTLGTTERQYLNNEFEELSAEVDRIAAVTEFNGGMLTDGVTASIDVQVGIQNTANDRATFNLGDLTTATLGVTIAIVDMTTSSGSQAAIDLFDVAINLVSGYRAEYGAAENRLNSALNNLETFSESTKTAESQIRDADFAFETAEMSRNQIMQQAGTAILAQAKGINQGALQLLQN